MRSHNFKPLPIVYIEPLFIYSLKRASWQPKHRSCYILLINYILHKKVVLEYSFIYFINNITVSTGIHGNFSLFTSSSNGPSAAATTAEFAEVTVVPVATAGPCSSPCRTIFPFLILLFFMTFIVAVTQMPLLMIVLRFVSSCDSSFSGLLPLTLHCQIFVHLHQFWSSLQCSRAMECTVSEVYSLAQRERHKIPCRKLWEELIFSYINIFFLYIQWYLG